MIISSFLFSFSLFSLSFPLFLSLYFSLSLSFPLFPSFPFFLFSLPFSLLSFREKEIMREKGGRNRLLLPFISHSERLSLIVIVSIHWTVSSNTNRILSLSSFFLSLSSFFLSLFFLPFFLSFSLSFLLRKKKKEKETVTVQVYPLREEITRK